MQLHQEFRDKGFEILAFPCDQFLSQEPGTNVDIKKLVREKFKADFPLFEKSEINGPATCEVYKYLRQNTEALNDQEGIVGEVPWNFSKFIVDGQTGQVFSYYNPRVSPLSLRNEIEVMLNRGDPYVPPANPIAFGGLKLSPQDLAAAATNSGCGGPTEATAAATGSVDTKPSSKNIKYSDKSLPEMPATDSKKKGAAPASGLPSDRNLEPFSRI